MALAANPKLCRLPLPPGAPLAFVLPARISLLQERRLIFPFTGSTSQDHIDKDHGLFVMGETDMERAAQGCFLEKNDICFFSLAEDMQTSQPFTLKPLQVPFCSVISSIYVAEKLTQHIWPFFFLQCCPIKAWRYKERNRNRKYGSNACYVLQAMRNIKVKKRGPWSPSRRLQYTWVN